MTTLTHTSNSSNLLPKMPIHLGHWLVHIGIILAVVGIVAGFWQVVDDVRIQADRRMQEVSARHQALMRCEWEPSIQSRESCRVRVPHSGQQAPLASMTSEINPPVNMAYR